MAQSDPDNLCLRCGYSLEGLPDVHRCPECGLPYGSTAPVWRNRQKFERMDWPQIKVGIVLLPVSALIGWLIGGRSGAVAIAALNLFVIVVHVLAQLVFGSAWKAIEDRLRIDVVVVEPEGLLLFYGNGRRESVVWSCVSRVTLARLGAAAHVWRRDTASVFDLNTHFRGRSDARRFVELANEHLSTAAAIHTTATPTAGPTT